MKNILKIGTHSGTFHADESLAVYMLRLLPKYSGAELVRTRDLDELEKCDIVVDVSGKYDGVRFFDHHQREFDGVLGNGFNTKLSSAGLVYKHFGHQVIAAILKEDENAFVVQESYKHVYKNFVEAIDANDNGISVYDNAVIDGINGDNTIPYNLTERFISSTITLPSAVSRMNPMDYEFKASELTENQVYDMKFNKASQFIGSTFVDMVMATGKGWYPSKEKMEKVFSNALESDTPRILVLDEGCNWKSHFFEIEKRLVSQGKISGTDDTKPLYIVFPGGDSWRVQAIGVSPGSFVSRKALPEPWRGVRDEALSKISGIEGGVFVHAGGFIGGNKTKEGALEMAKKAIEFLIYFDNGDGPCEVQIMEPKLVNQLSLGIGLKERDKLGFERLPSFAEIKAVQLDKYLQELANNPTLSQLKQDSETVTEVDENETKASRLIKSFLYGSPKTKQEVKDLETSFSKTLMRGKYVHEIATHKVIPGKALEYHQLITEIYPIIANDPDNGMDLVGSWRTLVGDMDTYIHIWEYKGYPGFHHSQNKIHENVKYLEYLARVRPLLRSRESDLMQEFEFWGGTAQPHNYGGIFELRTYDLYAGKLLEWEQHWRIGLEYRKKVMEPVGAWFTHLGRLNRVHHLWQFADLEHRKISREKSWEIVGWADTVHETVKLIEKMESHILVPLEFSPVK